MTSISVNRIIGNIDNAIRPALITPSSQRGSTDIRITAQSKQGRGRMNVTGPYTGAVDSVIDVEIIGGAGAAMRATTPVTRGVGNGQMTISAITPGAVAQTLTFALLDAGDPSVAATLDFFGVTLAAKTPGAAGNALSLSVTQNLTTAALPYALLDAITKGTTDFDGPAFDWGSPATADGGIPSSAPRIRFDGFPQVHRAWKEWNASAWTYHIDPAPEYDLPTDTQLLAVSGDYTLTLTDGTTTETYHAITLYDFLTQVQARSAMIEVRGTIADDRAPGGMAVTDIPLRTDAHALPATKSVQSIYATPLQAVAAAPTAPTENIKITCKGAGAVGREVWSVAGSVSGTLPDALTDEEYDQGPIRFHIPPIITPITNQARISAKPSYVSRDTAKGEGLPSICLNPLTLGAQATDKTITYTYTARPPTECSCDGKSVGAPSDFCLGLEDQNMGTLDAAYQTRLTALYQWRSDMVAGNTTHTPSSVISGTPGIPGTPPVTTGDSWSINASFSIGLDYIYVRFDDFTNQQDTQSAADALKNSVITSGYAIEGGAVTAAGYTGICLTTYDSGLYDMTGDSFLYTNVLFNQGTIVSPGTPGTPGTPDQVSSASLSGAYIDIKWIDAATDILAKNLADIYDITAAATEWDALFVIVQNDLQFLLTSTADDVGNTPPTDEQQLSFLNKYKSHGDYILSLAGIPPKSDASSTTAAGDGCWQDDPSATFWWVPDDDELAPAFNNKVYVSSRKGCGQNHPAGAWYSTQEFGFGLVVDCPERLKTGDQIKITIKGTGGGGTYVAGDTFTVPLIAAQAAPFIEGKDGSPTHTWTVRSTASGALPDWHWNPEAPTDYTAGPAITQLAPGGIPFEIGDVITYAIEGGQLQWRRDGGAWATADLFGGGVDLGDGLTLTAVPGSAPSFLPSDRWTFKAAATYGIDQLRQPRIGKGFAWDGDSVALDIDLGKIQPCPILLLALHSLPAAAMLTISGGDTAVGEWTTTTAVIDGPILDFIDGRTARYLRVVVTGTTTGAQIGWLYAGSGWQPTVSASSLSLSRQYGLSRGQGLNPTALYRGRGTGGAWAWSIDQGAALDGSNADALIRLVDHVAAQGIEPVCMVPDVNHSQQAALAVIDTDALRMDDVYGYQGAGRQVSVELPLRAVLA